MRGGFPRGTGRLGLLPLALLISLSCDGEPTAAVYSVDQRAVTVVLTTNSDGTVSSTESDDLELVGPKRVGLAITALQSFDMGTIVLTFWPAGSNDFADSIEIPVDETFEANTAHSFPREIPGSADLGLCDALYYSWTFTYHDAAGRPGTYFGQARRLMPTKRFTNGQLEQALCAEPPGPEV